MTLLVSLPAAAAYECVVPPFRCTVEFSDSPDDSTGNYPLWGDCFLDDGSAFWTMDGELEEIPSDETLANIYEGLLEECRFVLHRAIH
jgi:hypothetical protein